MTQIPDGLPTLSGGSHGKHEGKACVMEYVSLLAGEEWSDMPSCTNRLIARAAQAVNDRAEDKDRHLLVPVIGRLFGTDADIDDKEFATRIYEAAYPLLNKVSSLSLSDALYELVGHMSCVGEPGSCGYERAVQYLTIGVQNAAFHKVKPLPMDTVTNLYALTPADHINIEPCNHTEEGVAFLNTIIDIYDELAGRNGHRDVTADELAKLAGQLAASKAGVDV